MLWPKLGIFRLSSYVQALISQTQEPNLMNAASLSYAAMGSSLINFRHLLGNFGGWLWQIKIPWEGYL